MEEINAIVGKIDEIKKSMDNFATVEKVEALAKEIGRFAEVKKAAEKAQMAHKTFGTQGAYSAVAAALCKGLVAAGKVEASKAGEWMKLAGAADITSIDDSTSMGGNLFLPVGIDPVISKLVEQNGVARRNVRVIPGVKGTLGIKSRATRVTVGGMARPDATYSRGNSTYENSNLTTYQVGLITTVEEQLIWNSPINLVEEAISDLAEAAAELEDDVLFRGDGTAAYLGFTGLNSANTGVGGADVDTAALTVDDALNVRTKVHTSVFGNGKYYMHPYVFAELQTKKASTAGSYHFDPQSASFKLGGSVIEFAPRMDSALTDEKVVIVYGDLNKAVAMGLGRGYEIRVLTERYADEGAIGIRLTYDAGMVLVQPTAVAKVTIETST
jgi:HK97 family phage major capsid protein